MGWRIDIEADDVAQLVDKLGVGGKLELFHAVRLKAVRTPDALNRTRADIDDLPHHGGRPVGRLRWRLALDKHHDTLVNVRPQRLDARRPLPPGGSGSRWRNSAPDVVHWVLQGG